MQGIYHYLPETNHVSRVYSVAAVLYLQFVLYVMLFRILNVLFFNISTFRSKCAVPKMAAFCSSLISYVPDMLFRYCLSDFEMVPVAPTTTGINFAFTFYMPWISIKSFYILKISQMLSWSHFCLQELQYLLTFVLFYYNRHGLLLL